MSAEPKKVKITKHLVGIILMSAAAYSVFFIDWNTEVEDPPPMIRPLKTLEVGKTFEGTGWQYPGKASAGAEASLSFEVSGIVKSILVKEGQQVTEGEILAELDDRDYRNAVASAQAEVDRSKAQYDRVKEAAEFKAVSEQEVSNTLAALDKAKAQLDIHAKALEDTVLKARFDGTIAKTYIQNFENVQAKQDILLLHNLGQIEIKAAIPEARLAHVDPARRVTDSAQEDLNFYATFDYFPGQTFPLEPKEFSAEADPITQTFTATLVMNCPKNVIILPGMSAMVYEAPKLKKKDPNLLLPLNAVPVDGVGQYFVWLLEDAGNGVLTATRRDVTVGEMTDSDVIIKSGIARGDLIAAAGVHVLVEGQQVRPL